MPVIQSIIGTIAMLSGTRVVDTCNQGMQLKEVLSSQLHLLFVTQARCCSAAVICLDNRITALRMFSMLLVTHSHATSAGYSWLCGS